MDDPLSEDTATGGNLPPVDAEVGAAYRVLARKYRPAVFSQMIGQAALVRTLTNAIDAGRLAHAFMLSGVRGVGKTTTARIIARALNCVGADGRGEPTPEPCGVCEHCRAIAEDRHVDVIEMDAASRTGVDDIREIIEGVRYRPSTARYKVYIIDEVHMLSRNAFNALLKTLEEPPEHTKFIFATTEIRKVPVTVLSRCQRFDLRRVEAAELARHLQAIAQQEEAAVDPAALAMIARAADGSVRDGLSLLDQAIAHCGGEVGAADVRDMLGLADRVRIFDLMDAVMGGNPAAALDQLADQHASGADPAIVVEDLLGLVHWLTRIKVAPATADEPGVPEAERTRGKDMAGRLAMAVLTRAWQMLLKGLNEVRAAPSPLQAAEMVLVRLAYAADLPTPGEALKALRGEAPAAAAAPVPPPTPEKVPPPRAAEQTPPVVKQASPPAPEAPPVEAANPDTFAAVVTLARERREARLSADLANHVHIIRFEPGHIEFRQSDNAPVDLANRLTAFLQEATGRPWMVAVSKEVGEPTLKFQEDAEAADALAEAEKHPLVRSVLDTFPGARVTAVRSRTPPLSVSPDDPEDPEADTGG